MAVAVMAVMAVRPEGANDRVVELVEPRLLFLVRVAPNMGMCRAAGMGRHGGDEGDW